MTRSSPLAQADEDDGDLRYFEQSAYADLDWNHTLDYMNRRYVQPVQRLLGIERATLADCAAGFGWLSFAWLEAGGGHAILIEPDAPRLDSAREMAAMLGLTARCTFVCDSLQNWRRSPGQRVDVFATVETLEHVGRPQVRASIQTLIDSHARVLVITTPNARFPAVAHDTRLPFAHWLPHGPRRLYAALAGRSASDHGNDFLWPSDLAPVEQAYRCVSSHQTFSSYSEFLRFYPHVMPYGPEALRRRAHPSLAMNLLVRHAGRWLGTRAWRWSQNMASVWVKR